MTQMAKMLAILNGAEVARRLGVSRNAVSEWARTDSPPASREAQVRGLMLDAMEDEEAAWPEWAKRLNAKMDALVSDAALAESLREARRTTARRADDAAPPRNPDSPSRGR
jgi:transcriptional regulator with XRE-family HTH domain